MTPEEVSKALAAISSLAIVASSLPTAAVRASLRREHIEAHAAGGPCPQPLGVLIDLVDACSHLGRLGGDLERVVQERARTGR